MTGAASYSRRPCVAYGGVSVWALPKPFHTTRFFEPGTPPPPLVGVATDPGATMPVTDENELYALVGEIMVLSARVETSLESCIAACLSSARLELSQPVLRRLNLTDQLATLHEVAQLLYDRRDTTLVEFRRWLRRLGRVRQRRNNLVHNVLRVTYSPEALGRWKSEIGYMRQVCAQAPEWAAVLEARVVTLSAQLSPCCPKSA